MSQEKGNSVRCVITLGGKNVHGVEVLPIAGKTTRTVTIILRMPQLLFEYSNLQTMM